MDVRQRWRVGAGCNPVALRLSRFESFYIHHLKEYLWCFLKWYKPLIVGYLLFLQKAVYVRLVQPSAQAVSGGRFGQYPTSLLFVSILGGDDDSLCMSQSK